MSSVGEKSIANKGFFESVKNDLIELTEILKAD
jgi:hypothetical protein